MKFTKLFKSRLPQGACLILNALAMATLLFFSSYHFFYDSYTIGVVGFVVFVIACFAFLSLLNNASVALFGTIFLFSAGAMLVLVSYLYGYRGLLYCFALPTGLFLILEFRLAFITGLGFCGINLWAASYSMDEMMVSRFAIALALSFAFSAVISYTLFEQQNRHEREANEDYLTGLMNQRSFYNWLSGHLKLARNLGEKLTLYYFDIDEFKSINDSFGHEGGDRVLKEFSRRIREFVETSYLEINCGDDIKFCRLSGDEFVLACSATSSLEMAEAFASGMQSVLSEPFALGERVVNIRSSIGVHHFQVHNQNLSFVMRSADLAMYKAKSSSEYQFYFTENGIA